MAAAKTTKETETITPYMLEIAVMICGAVVMVYELTGSRLLAPFVGTSVYVWTSLIGVIMAGLSLGYWLGGKFADKKADMQGLSHIIWFSGISIFTVYLIKNPILAMIGGLAMWMDGTEIIASLLLFFVPSLLLGMISPYAAKLKLNDINSSGRVVGNLYALSTLGSIIGTFLAGYYLIPTFGSQRILAILSIILAFLSIVVGKSGTNFLKAKITVLLLMVMFTYTFGEARPNRLVADVDSEYNRIWVFDYKEQDTGKTVRYMATDPFTVQSGTYLDNDELVYRYSKFYRLGDYFNPAINKGLVIGGAGFSYPKDFLIKHPIATLDVVEIDPVMTEIAREYFNLKDNSRMRIHHEDGRMFLNRNKEKYDAIYLDAFNSRTIPFHLTTLETVEAVYRSLEDNGVVLLNAIAAMEGENRFLRAELATFLKVFPEVRIFQVEPGTSVKHEQNFILVARKNSHATVNAVPTSEQLEMLASEWKSKIDTADIPVLTDDYAPIEEYTKQITRREDTI